MDERDHFVNMWTHRGITRTVRQIIGGDGSPRSPDTKFTYNPQGPDGKCWDHAYNYAREHGFAYVEGGVLIPGEAGLTLVRAHAWVEETQGSRVIIHEVTEGYDGALQYKGIEVPDTEEIRAAVDRVWELEGMRCSTIEAIIILSQIQENLRGTNVI